MEFFHALAIEDNEKFDQARKKRLKADLERAALVTADKKILSEMITAIDIFISNLNPVEDGYKTNEAAQIELDLIVRIKGAIDVAEKAGAELL